MASEESEVKENESRSAGKVEENPELPEKAGEEKHDFSGESKEKNGGNAEKEEELKDGTDGKAEKGEEEEEEENGKGSSDKEEGAESGEELKLEAVTPSSDRPTRERKTVERYSDPAMPRSSGNKGLSIEKGHGTQLKDIPNVAFKLSKRKADDNLQMFHTILFGKKAKVQVLKKNIGKFSGYVWARNEEKERAKIKDKLDKCVKEKLIDFCDLLNIPINKAVVKKEELCTNLFEFLESPHATTDILLAEQEKKVTKSNRKATSGKKAGSGEVPTDAAAKKQKHASLSGGKRKQPSKTEGDVIDKKSESSNVEEDSEEDSGKKATTDEETDNEESKSGEVEEESKTPKTKSKKTATPKSGGKSVPTKKGTPAKSKGSEKSVEKSSSATKKGVNTTEKSSSSQSKSKEPASKKQRVEKESTKNKGISSSKNSKSKKQSSKSPAKDSAKGKAKTSKKAEAEPTREEIQAALEDILKDVDFNTATLSDILKQLGDHFGVDLRHRKSEIKDIIAYVINNMSDEEDGKADKSGSDDADADGEAEKSGSDVADEDGDAEKSGSDEAEKSGSDDADEDGDGDDKDD